MGSTGVDVGSWEGIMNLKVDDDEGWLIKLLKLVAEGKPSFGVVDINLRGLFIHWFIHFI